MLEERQVRQVEEQKEQMALLMMVRPAPQEETQLLPRR